MLSVKIGEHCYYGLCDIGASTSAFSHALYMEIRKEIEHCELEDIDVVIQLANRETICPIGIVEMLKFYVVELNTLLISWFLLLLLVMLVLSFLVDLS